MRYIFLILSLLFIVSCTSKSTTNESINQTAENYTVQYARHFRFVEKNNQVVLEIINPDSKKVVAVLQPLKENKRVIALSGTFIGMLDKLQLANNIVGVSEIKYVYNQKVRNNFSAKKVLEAGYDTQLTLEPMITSKPALILHSGYNAEFSHQKQFENAGIQCVPVFDWREETPLGKAEWIKVYGFLYGKSEEAQSIFEDIEKKYNQLKEQAKQLAPSQLLMSGNVMGGEWCSPAGGSFMAELMKDANINYAYLNTKGSGSIMQTQEKVLAENKNAVYWINPGAKSLAELKSMNSKAILFDAFKNQQVYCYQNKDNFYWEVSSIQPDKLLADLIQITHPEFKPEDRLYFYDRLK